MIGKRLWKALLRRFEDPIKSLRKRGVLVGQRVSIMSGVIIDDSHGWHIEIGDDVTLAPRVHLLAHDASTKIFLNCTRIGKVTIGNRVFIGAGSIVLPGVSIGDDVIIGAGSVVAHDVPSFSVAAGNPAKVICPLDQFLNRRKKQMETVPFFGEEYHDAQITASTQSRINEAMKDRFGFVR